MALVGFGVKVPEHKNRGAGVKRGYLKEKRNSVLIGGMPDCVAVASARFAVIYETVDGELSAAGQEDYVGDTPPRKQVIVRFT